jgi:hypothetical protein
MHQYDPVLRNINIIALLPHVTEEIYKHTSQITAESQQALQCPTGYLPPKIELCFALSILSLSLHQKLKLQLQKSLHNSTYEVK